MKIKLIEQEKKIMKASEICIKDYIGGQDQVFTIPPFQRNYAWTKKNCQEL